MNVRSGGVFLPSRMALQPFAECAGERRRFMIPSRLIQVIAVNVILAVAGAVVLFQASLVPATLGALTAGGVLYMCRSLGPMRRPPDEE